MTEFVTAYSAYNVLHFICKYFEYVSQESIARGIQTCRYMTETTKKPRRLGPASSFFESVH
jgi:hypothetical protein